MISPERNSRRESYIAFQKSKVIAIYGYYSQGRKRKLEDIRDHLNQFDFSAKIASDIEIPDSSSPHSYEEEAALTSEQLYDTSDIHIFILIPPTEHEEKLLDSVAMEYGWVRKDRQRYVGIFIKRGSDLATLCEGSYSLMKELWIKHDFNTIDEIFDPLKRYCEAAIREMWSQLGVAQPHDTGYHR